MGAGAGKEDLAVGRAEALPGQIYTYLSSIYGDKVHRDEFRRKCLERGMRPEEIASAEVKYGISPGDK